MKILVLGGSYFLGKRFVEYIFQNKKHEITVFNRGSRPLNIEGICELFGDRHDSLDILKLEGEYDVVVDFCAYESGDIADIFAALSGKFKQYIFISTVDVYERGLGRMLSENAPFETRDFGGDAGRYILGKAALEKEIKIQSEKYNTKYTVLRPAFIYGPDNYAPREDIYFYWIDKAGQIIHPEDATGEFQMVYVDDVVRALDAAIGNSASFNEAYNIAPLKMENYDSFADALKEAVHKEFSVVSVPVSMVIENSIPLPFPLTAAESNYYNGEKALELVGEYTSLSEGLEITAGHYFNS